MPVKSTTKEFIEKAILKHGNKYNYSKVNYINNSTKVTIICPVHGEFEQRPGCHSSGKGCNGCGLISKGNLKASDTETFIKNAIKIHGDLYDYSKSVYKRQSDKVEIICKKHNSSFFLTPKSHLSVNNVGCPICSSTIKTNEKFILDATNTHNDKYTYIQKYINNKTKLDILCNSCNTIFKQTPNAHLGGDGCPKCGQNSWSYSQWESLGKRSRYFDGFKIYLVEFWNENERFYKIGKTFNSISIRFRGIPYEFKIINVVEGSALYISNLEKAIQKECRIKNTYTPQIKFKGNTECFTFTPEIKQIFQQLAC